MRLLICRSDCLRLHRPGIALSQCGNFFRIRQQRQRRPTKEILSHRCRKISSMHKYMHLIYFKGFHCKTDSNRCVLHIQTRCKSICASHQNIHDAMSKPIVLHFAFADLFGVCRQSIYAKQTPGK